MVVNMSRTEQRNERILSIIQSLALAEKPRSVYALADKAGLTNTTVRRYADEMRENKLIKLVGTGKRSAMLHKVTLKGVFYAYSKGKFRGEEVDALLPFLEGADMFFRNEILKKEFQPAFKRIFDAVLEQVSLDKFDEPYARILIGAGLAGFSENVKYSKEGEKAYNSVLKKIGNSNRETKKVKARTEKTIRQLVWIRDHINKAIQAQRTVLKEIEKQSKAK